MTLEELAAAYGRWNEEERYRDALRRLRADLDSIWNRRANQPEHVAVDGELMSLAEFQKRMGLR